MSFVVCEIKKATSDVPEPIPKSSQPWFVNSVVNVRCEINPEKVLEILLRIENYFGSR